MSFNNLLVIPFLLLSISVFGQNNSLSPEDLKTKSITKKSVDIQSIK